MLELAAALLLLMGLAHTVLGEHYLLMPLGRRDNLPKLFGDARFALATLRFVWHLISVAWAALAYQLVVAAQGEVGRQQLLGSIGIACLVSALLPLWLTRGRHLSWLVFLLVGGLVLAAR